MSDLYRLVEMKNPGSINLHLKALVDKKGITRNALAKSINARFEVVNKWYNNDVDKLDLDVLARICYVLGCEVGDILQYEPPKEQE